MTPTASSNANAVTIRAATPADVETLLALIAGIAAFEKLSHKLVVTAEALEAALFGPNPHAACLVAELDGQVVAYTTLNYTFSSFQGRYGLYIDDLYVHPDARSHGIGAQMMRAIAQKAVDENLGRIEWAVLNWNEGAIRFYDNLGAESLSEWTSYRLEGDAIARVAKG